MIEKMQSTLLRALAIIALSQAPFWLAQSEIPLQRPLINLDMVLAAIIGTWYRPLGLVGLVQCA